MKQNHEFMIERLRNQWYNNLRKPVARGVGRKTAETKRRDMPTAGVFPVQKFEGL